MAYFDLQVNGYGGIDFNQDDLRAEDLHAACERLAADGLEGILATIITESLDTMAARLRRLVELREQDAVVQRVITGLHIEGPFINEADGYRGAHPLDAVRPAKLDDALQLLDGAGALARIVTLAPECDPGLQVTSRLTQEGVVVSAGHCNPTLDELKAAIDAGLSMFTHLGNGCPMQMHRHDNIVQRVLSLTDELWITFIADGAHIPLFALKNYLDVVGLDRAIVVTDAIAPAGLGPGNYTVSRWRVRIGDDLVARAPDGSHLIGAAMSMPRVIENLRSIGLSDADVELVTFHNPKRAIGKS
ncbi:MAG: N-acetylglucosamine-6-phosphate deacetylase [Pirellulales bacterium]